MHNKDDLDTHNNEEFYEYHFIDKSTNQENEKFIQSLIELNTFSQKVTSILDFGLLLNTILELSEHIIKTEKAVLLLQDESGYMSIKTALNVSNEVSDIDKFYEFVLKKMILQSKGNSGYTNSLNTLSFKNLNSCLFGVLKLRENIIGYIILFNKQEGDKKFNDRDKYLIQTISAQASIAIENSNLYEKVKNEANIRSNLQRYLPRNIVSKIMDNKINISLGGELQNCTILFSDICGFTSISESMTPQSIVYMLNQYMTIMTKIIFSYNGSVDKFIGDGIMAVFGAPISTPNHALEATLCAIEMRRQIATLQEKFAEEFDIKDFNIRIGINTGNVVYGNVGSPQRMDFTVIGDDVNIASRMESNAPRGGILVSQSTYEKVKNSVSLKEWNPIHVKGKSEPVRVYEVIDKLAFEGILKLDNSMRMYIRIPLKTFVSINKEQSRSSGLIRDISLGGVSIGTVGDYKLEEIIYMTFKLSNNTTFRNIKGVIKRIDKARFESTNNKNNIIMGVEFLDIPEDQKTALVYFIKESEKKRKASIH